MRTLDIRHASRSRRQTLTEGNALRGSAYGRATPDLRPNPAATSILIVAGQALLQAGPALSGLEAELSQEAR